MSEHPKTPEEALRDGFAALLRGDTDGRDRAVRHAETLMKAGARGRALAKLMAVDFMVDSQGCVFPTRDILREAL
jgi:hypothetical protein